MRHRLVVGVLGICGLLPAACVGEGDPEGHEATPPAALTGTLALVAGSRWTGGDTYPPPPYGFEAGSLLENASFPGPDGPIDFASFRDPDAKLLVVHSYANWCFWCTMSVPAQVEWYERYEPEGLRMLNLIFEDTDGDPADVAAAEEVFGPEGFDVNFPFAADPYFDLGRYYDAAAMPLFLFIDLPEMRIRSLETGFDAELYESMIQAALAEPRE